MIVDNGNRVRLIIDGVFHGGVSVSRGRVSFVPHRVGRKPQDAEGGLLDGAPVKLVVVAEGGL